MHPDSPSPPQVASALLTYFKRPAIQANQAALLEPLAENFLRLKRALGCRFEKDRVYLHNFLAFLAAQGIRSVSDVSADALPAWQASLLPLAPSTQERRQRVVTAFLKHISIIHGVPEVTPETPPARAKILYRPYLFTEDQLRLLLARAELPGPWQRRARVYALISACGLRPAEACRLRVGDFHADQATILLECTKFNKDRLLPLPPSALGRMRKDREEMGASVSPQRPFFLNEQGRPFTSAGLSRTFHKDLVAWGIYEPTRVAVGVRHGSPRLYSLRHTFATNRLLSWYREGANVQAKLPLLCTYLGHRSIRETQVYLHITGLILQQARERFANRSEKEFPLKP
jgi:site-specific recombinase XerD